MSRSALALLLALVAGLLACTDKASVPQERTPDPWSGRLWSLVSLNGQAVPYGPGKGDVFATRTGSVIWFEAGCGFSVSVHESVPVVRDPHRTSRPCSPIDLDRLAAVEAMMRDGGSISINEDKGCRRRQRWPQRRIRSPERLAPERIGPLPTHSRRSEGPLHATDSALSCRVWCTTRLSRPRSAREG